MDTTTTGGAVDAPRTVDQTRVVSAVEACMNVGSGFFISLAVWIWVVVPLWDIPVEPHDNFMITCVFTVSSLLRSYAIRRFFANGWHRAATSAAAQIIKYREKLKNEHGQG